MLRKSEQFLLRRWSPSCYFVSSIVYLHHIALHCVSTNFMIPISTVAMCNWSPFVETFVRSLHVCGFLLKLPCFYLHINKFSRDATLHTRFMVLGMLITKKHLLRLQNIELHWQSCSFILSAVYMWKCIVSHIQLDPCPFFFIGVFLKVGKTPIKYILKCSNMKRGVHIDVQ